MAKHQRDGHWRYPEDGLDLSNTQYALLGLWAASRCGFKIPESVWFKSLEWLRSRQAAGAGIVYGHDARQWPALAMGPEPMVTVVEP